MLDRTQNRLTTIAFQWSILALFAVCMFAPGAQAQPAQAAESISINGVYNGTYAGEDGPTKFKLSLTQQDNGTLAGEFTLYVDEGAATNEYTCDLRGRYIAATRMVQLLGARWKTPPPAGIVMAGMIGVFDPAGGNGAGQISGKMRARPGAKFQAIRDPDESAKMASAAADKKDAAASAMPMPANAAAPRASSTPPSSKAPGTLIAPAAIDGVYTGTYGSNPDDKVPAKLYVKFINDGSVNGTLAGLFTFDVPPAAGAKPITYTYKLIGTYAVGQIQFWSAKPLGKPAPDAYALKSLSAEFGRTPPVKGRNGQLEFNLNPDEISGPVIDSNNRPTNRFEGTRDKDESAKLDSVMAAQSSAAGAVVSPTPPAAASPIAPPAAPATVVRPDIEGVFNGTYTRANEPPTKFKLTITRPPDGSLAGVATIYLPSDSGTNGYTYSLEGAQDGRGDFHLFVHDWETIPPKDFKNFKAMGFKGTFRSNVNQNSARIISIQASGSLASFFVPQFEAAWDATESADINGTIAAQKAIGDADQAAASQAHAQAIKTAPPKQLASKDLVRKSKAYWDAYQGDFIREIFDGGFASDVDDDPIFKAMFVRYVELFSKDCSAYLPADHKIVTITTVTTRNGVVTDTQTETVEIDSRFVDKFAEYSGVDPTPGSAQAQEETKKAIAIAGRILQVGGPSHGTSPADARALLQLVAAHGIASGQDMNQFFATEVKTTGPSAALRQMGENLLRGATGEPSLQEAGAKIDGAEAETDKDLPPGRFARFIDGAHAFYRDPANARLESRFETAFDEALAAKYQGVMTREEEYYYANDFGPRFRAQIMQDRSHCTDPAWPRLHPAVEECVVDFSK